MNSQVNSNLVEKPKKQTFGIKPSKKGKWKAFFSQLSRGLMLPIAILPIAGLLLGIGGAIGANVSSEAGIITANIFKGMSEVVFANLPVLFAVAITITFSKDKGASGFCSLLAFLVFISIQIPFIQKGIDGSIDSILWFHKGSYVTSITTTTLGFTTLQTSIFGGIIVGALTSVIYNKVSMIKLPTALDFFSGVRLVPLILIPAMLLLALVFLTFWPWIGQGIYEIGKGIQAAPSGTGGLLYGILGRSLMPFGLHHIPIVLAFQTSFGGVITIETMQSSLINAGIVEGSQTYETIVSAFASFGGTGITVIEGDQNIWNFVNSLPFNNLPGNGVEIPIFEWFTKYTNTYPGRYTQDYPTYLGVCMGIGGALIYASEKKNRRNVSVIIGSAMLVAFLTGITEPLEFTFLFCAPWLYYLIYVPLSGFSYMFMELLGAHIGVGFARGFIDLIIYGAIPVMKGTNFYWALVLALIEGLFAFATFSFFIKKFKIETIGRGQNVTSLITKKDYEKLKSDQKNGEQRIIQLIQALGGKNNIEDVSACATRLRVSVKATNSLKKENFSVLGSKGEIIKENSLQLIFGGEASILADKVNDYLNEGYDKKTIIDQKPSIENKGDQVKIKITPFNVYAPMDGIVYNLKQVPDDAFKNKMLGEGLAILPKSSNIYSPVKNGTISLIAETQHCYFIKPNNNEIDIMMHLGIDSIKNGQQIFKPQVTINQKVTNNDIITKIDLEKLNQCKSSISPIVIPEVKNTNGKIYWNVKNGQKVNKGDLLMTIK